MGIRPLRLTLLACACVVLSVAAPAYARVHPGALDRALRSQGFYVGSAAHARTTVALTSGRRSLGTRTLRLGKTGWDVAELQLELAWHGFPSGTIDGSFGAHVAYALASFQRAAGLKPDAVAGAATIDALRRAPARVAIPLVWPLLAAVGDHFGPRSDRFHAGIDLPAPSGTAVIAAAPGRVTWAAPRAGGWGNLVTVAHGHGVRTLYAHLSLISVKVGQWVAGGTILGRVGATGDATGPHLHFEVRVHGAAVDPLGALVSLGRGA